MSRRTISWRQRSAIGAVLLLGACAQSPHTRSGLRRRRVWRHELRGADGRKVIADLTAVLQRNPDSVATIVGGTDTVGSADYNMQLSHRRADAVRDAIIYSGNAPADRVETRWTGESRQKVATANNVADPANRIVDIAIH